MVRKLPKLDNIIFTVESKGIDLVPDLAFNNDIPLDISKPFMPFGKEPRIFDIFAIGSSEPFSKKGGTIKLNIELDPGGSLGPPTAILFDEYLFRWDQISDENSSQNPSPENDNQRIRDVLILKYRIDWVKKGKIDKLIPDTIRISDEKNSILIKLNSDKTKAILTIDDGRTDEFIVKTDNVVFDKKIRVFARGFFGKFIEIKTNPEDPEKESEWIDHGFPPNTKIFASSTPSAVVYIPFNSSTADSPELFSIFLRGDNGHLIERLFDTKKIQWEWIDWQSPRQYLFNWDKIPGVDSLKLIEYLKLNFGFVKIQKIENVDDCTKKIYTDSNSILLKYFKDKSKVVLKSDDGRTDEFNAKMENGKLNMYSQKDNVDINSDPAAIYDNELPELSVFVIASDNYLYEFNKKKGEWKCHPHENNQTFDSSPFVVIDKSVHDKNIVRIFLKGQNGQLFQLKSKMGDDSSDDSWNAIESLPLGVKADSRPFAGISDNATNILIYIKGDDNQLWEYDNANDPKWNVIKNNGVTFDSDPHGYIHIGSSPEPSSPELSSELDTNISQLNIRIFLRGTDNSLYEYNNEKKWDTNHQMPVKLANSPFVLNENINDKLLIFSDTSQNRILERIVPFQAGTQNNPSWIEHKDPNEQILTPSLSWEYLTDTGWTVLKEIKDETSNLLTGGKIELRVPDDIVESKIAGKENYWIRARLIGGNYGEEIFIANKNITSSSNAASTQLLNFTKTNIKPPIFEKITIEYSFEEKKDPEQCIVYNNLRYLDQTQASKIPDKFFEPFVQPDEEFPSIYMGFDKILKSGPLRIFFAAKELPFTEDNKPIMKWSYSKDTYWNELEGYSDNTEGLIKTDILEFAGPPDFSARTLSVKYLYWIKGSLTRGIYEEEYPLLSGIYPNTTFAVQAETIREEILGSSDGRPDQIFSFLRVPVLEGEEIRVQEVLTDQEKQDLIDQFEKDKNPDGTKVDPIFEVKDETGMTIETWVLWSEVQNFFDSTKKDRHYTLDRATGKIKFGNGTNGFIPTMGENNVKAFLYQTGGGADGNIHEREIKSLKSAVTGIDKVLNPGAADGGAEAATLDQMLEIGPAMISHRNRAVTVEDFEWLVKKASRKIAKVKCLSNTNNQTNANNEHLKEKGWVTIIIVPDEKIPKPVPSLELKRKVRSYLEDHCANIISSPGHVWVDGPTYIDISVSVDVLVTSIDLISVVEREVKGKLDEFFHPLTGGPEGEGWDFGRDVNVSDIYALLGEIDGVDHLENLILDYDVPNKEFLFCWNEISDDNTRLLDYLITNFDANWVTAANIINSDEQKANLFSWDEFLEKDSRLIDFLIPNFYEDWIRTAKIERIFSKYHEMVMIIKLSDGKNCLSLKLNPEQTKIKVMINDIIFEEFMVNKENDKLIIKTRTIKISDGENSLLLRLNNSETKVNLIINDGRTDEFIVKNENGRLNIYSQDIIEIRPDFLVASGTHTINTQFSKGE
ncbi:MAG: putative baseplate assembly protein [Candidatus Methanoperedens sp.]|nr:putative baseplate assembly protein [Candidatus Methanoperedens sp.]